MKPTHLCILLAALFAVAAATPKRYLFSTTSIDSMAPTTLGTNVLAQPSASSVRSLLLITNATGLEATAANLTTVSNSVTTLQGQLPGYATNYGASLTNATRIGGSSQGVTNVGVTASRVMIFDANGVPTNSSVSTTTLSYLDATSSIQTQLNTNAANTLLASNAVNTLSNALPAANLTGSVADARLSANVPLINTPNAYTGSNTFPAAKFFYPNGLPYRILLATNVSFTGNINPFTNTPPAYSDTTPVARFTLPALLGPNSIVRVSLLRWQTNTVGGSTFWTLHGGAATNFLSAGGGLGTTAVTNWVSMAIAFKNNNSFTQQVVNLGQSQSTAWQGLTAVDTSTNWTAFLGFTHATGGTVSSNISAGVVMFEEVVIP